MPRILVRGDWYDPVSGSSLYERDYEAAILANSEALFPGFTCVTFKPLVDSEFGRARADLALIDHLYRNWFVVEVELDSHPLESHVEEQVRKLSAGKYEDAHAEALHRACGNLDLSRLKSMLLGEQPRVLVVVTREVPVWSQRLARYGAHVAVVELFRDDLDRVVLRVDGEHPSALETEIVTGCSADPVMPRALRIHSPAALEGLDQVDLLFDASSTRWAIIRVQDAAYLVPVERLGFSFRRGSSWTIRRTGSDMSLESED